jgi:phosphorylase/glycogen(starch) synthase
MRREWSKVEILENNSLGNGSLVLGDSSQASLKLYIGNDIEPEDIGIEILLAEYNSKGRLCIKEVFPYTFKECADGIATYVCDVIPDKTGAYQVAGRIYAKNPLLPHRQDFELVRWL